MTTTEVDDFLFGSSCPSAKFPEIDAEVEGEVLDFELSQQTDIDGTKKFFESGDPMMQVVITLQTDQRDPEVKDDDGRRRLYAKGGKGTDKGKSMRDAIAEAVKKVDAKRLEKGAHLKVKYVADGPRPSAGKSPQKLYRAKYTAPVKSIDFDEEPF